MKRLEYTIYTNKIKSNIKALLISDFHNTRYEKILRSVPEDIDIILMPGDFCIRYFGGKRDRVVPFLKKLTKLAPTYVSLGNHDYVSMSIDEFKNMIISAGAVPLINSKENHIGLNILGFYPCGEYKKFYDLYDNDLYNIVLSHKPEWYFKYLKNTDFDLILSGHAHGGQIKLFGKALFAPGQGIFPKYVQGLYDDRLIVSAGVSNPILIPRLFNRREISIINIIKA